MRAQLTRLRNDRPEFTAIRQEAVALIDKGELDAARAMLGRGREVARALREETSRKEAEFLADEARIDHLQLSYRAAAAKYSEATSLVEPFDHSGAWRFALLQGSELADQGREFGDNAALVDAINAYDHANRLTSREQAPLDWAMTQNNLGLALATLGEREGDTARLEQAVEAYRDALEIFVAAGADYYAADCRKNLDGAQALLAERAK